MFSNAIKRAIHLRLSQRWSFVILSSYRRFHSLARSCNGCIPREAFPRQAQSRRFGKIAEGSAGKGTPLRIGLSKLCVSRRWHFLAGAGDNKSPQFRRKEAAVWLTYEMVFHFPFWTPDKYDTYS